MNLLTGGGSIASFRRLTVEIGYTLSF